MKLGFIGLGNMGFGMASNLLKEGHQVIAFDIDKEKLDQISELGAEKADSISQIATSVETVILCLPHPDISLDVIFNSNNLSTSGNTVKTIVDTSTLTPEDTEKIFQQLKDRDIDFLCAPMLGGKNAANNRKIHFLVEGERSIFEKCTSLFLSMGNRADYMGIVPSATIAKLAYNICRYSNVATATVVANFLRSYVKDTAPIYELLKEGSLDNFGQVWGEDIKEMVVEGIPYKPGNIPEKDLGLLIDIAKEQNLSDTLFKALKEIYSDLK